MRRRLWIMIVVSSLFAGGASDAFSELSVSTDFENGSAEVVTLDQNAGRIGIRPAGNPQRGWPCWWSFKLRGVQHGQTLQIEIDRTLGPLPVETGAGNEGKPLNPIWSHPERATYSVDGGRTWQQTTPGKLVDGRMRYTQRIDTTEAWFAWGPVFAAGDAQQLVDRLAGEHRFVKPFVLSETREKRNVPALVVRGVDKPRHAVWIQARQHAWESGSSWVARGFIEWVVSDDPQARSLREQAEVYFVPVMDIDSVATGNGGKGQRPQDHNRDWSAAPHFPEVAAAQQHLKRLSTEGRLSVFADLHNPGPGDNQPFFFAAPEEILSPEARTNLDTFFAAARRTITGPMVIQPKLHRSGPSYSTKWREISKNWVALNAGETVVAVTLETSWNTSHSTTEGYRTVGRQLGQAIGEYVKTLDK